MSTVSIIYTIFFFSDKPPIEELHQFLEFQLPRVWAPQHSDTLLLPDRRSSASLTINFIGPKLCVCIEMVSVFCDLLAS